MSVERRRERIDPKHTRLSVVRQCALLQISRSGHYYRPAGESEDGLALMRMIDEAFLESPYYGARQMMRRLHRLGHRVYPYLLRNLAVIRPNEVWCCDITYIPRRWRRRCPAWQARDFQHRSGQPVHFGGVHPDAEGCQCADRHGWPGAMVANMKLAA